MFGAYNYLPKCVDSFNTLLRGPVDHQSYFANALRLLHFKNISFLLVSKYISDKKRPFLFW